MISFVSGRLPLAAALLVAALSGCDTGSSRSSSNTTPLSLADPGGTVNALATVSSSLNAQVRLDAFTNLQAADSPSALALPDLVGLQGAAFVVGQSSGTIRVLDLGASGQPSLQRTITVDAGLASGVSLGQLRFVDQTLALVSAAGSGGEALYLFDPSATSPVVSRLDLSGVRHTWPAGTLNDRGTDVGAQALALSFPAGGAVAGGRLWIPSSNFSASFELNPGAVTHYRFDRANRQVSDQQVIQTTSFNPTGVTRLATPLGELLIVTNTGPYATGPASLDVIDPDTARIVGTIPCGPRNPVGTLVVAPDGRRAYLGSQSAAEVYLFDLEGLSALKGNASSQDLSARFLGGYSLPGAGSTHFVSGLAVSASGRYLYAVDFNESRLWALDLTQPELVFESRTFARGGTPANFENQANLLARRPGVPGVDFSGPALWLLTINLRASERADANVSFVLDGVEFDKN